MRRESEVGKPRLSSLDLPDQDYIYGTKIKKDVEGVA